VRIPSGKAAGKYLSVGRALAAPAGGRLGRSTTFLLSWVSVRWPDSPAS